MIAGLACDYMTATTKADSPTRGLEDLGLRIIDIEAKAGNEAKPFGMSGFNGFKCGNVEVATRDREIMLRASGHIAAWFWREIYKRADHVARFDVQVTLRVADGPTRRIEIHQQEALAHAAERHDIPIVRWVRENRGGYTLYLGARTSISFGRIYDAWQRHKLDHMVQCVRYEVQLHNQLATKAAMQLQQANSPLPQMAAYIIAFFSRRGVSLTLPDANGLTLCSPRSRSDRRRRLEWLQRSVRPCVELLAAGGELEEIISSLGLQNYVTVKGGPVGPCHGDGKKGD